MLRINCSVSLLKARLVWSGLTSGGRFDGEMWSLARPFNVLQTAGFSPGSVCGTQLELLWKGYSCCKNSYYIVLFMTVLY